MPTTCAIPTNAREHVPGSNVALVPAGRREPFLELLLLADESERQVRDYMDRGDLYVYSVANDLGGLILCLPVEAGVVELKAVAVRPSMQAQGIGTRMLAEVLALLKSRGYRRALVAAANAAIDALAFYQKAGFRMFRIEQDFFTPARGYPQAIVENGIRLRDKVWMEIALDVGPMPTDAVALLDESQSQLLDLLLAERIYEFNAEVTGYTDGKAMAACIRDDAGEVIAGFSGYTWGGCCEITYVWVHAQHRGRGLGRSLLQAAEAEALIRGCTQVVVMTHSFQAPQLYERLGYERSYAIEAQPRGHSNIVYTKFFTPRLLSQASTNKIALADRVGVETAARATVSRDPSAAR